MSDAIKVDAEGLHTHAAVCDTASAALTGTQTPAAAGTVHQATTAAVQHGNALVQAAAATLAGRATSTGDKLRAAAGNYTSTDCGSAQAISTTIEV
ncbi:type VII secretion target [Mycobacteroides chelonae]|uniref:type VII secretion target n=1 Tax=Mycobacteroides chelonae TaxID=1774 RepID=UPI0012FF5F5A|nr:type VII secretion target [Mycobacteroides chelonae]